VEGAEALDTSLVTCLTPDEVQGLDPHDDSGLPAGRINATTFPDWRFKAVWMGLFLMAIVGAMPAAIDVRSRPKKGIYSDSNCNGG